MTRMTPLTNDHNSINMIFAPDSNGFPASNRQGLRSLGSTFASFPSKRTEHNIHDYTYLQSLCLGKLLVKSLVTCLVFLALSTPNCYSAQANLSKPIPTELAVRAIIGEASNQGYEGMFAVACAIRNRGSLKGVYGLSANHVKDEPEKVRLMALTAWQNSIVVKFPNQDPTHGATNWENIHAFGKPSWAYSMIQTAVIKDHVFYREAK